MSGSDTIRSIIVTHVARLRCLVMKMYNMSDQKKTDTYIEVNNKDDDDGDGEENVENSNDYEYDYMLVPDSRSNSGRSISVGGKKADLFLQSRLKKTRWQNCCILQLEIQKNTRAAAETQTNNEKYEFILTLVYDGEVDNDEVKPNYTYWTKNPNSNEPMQVKKQGWVNKIFTRSNKPQDGQPVKKKFIEFWDGNEYVQQQEQQPSNNIRLTGVFNNLDFLHDMGSTHGVPANYDMLLQTKKCVFYMVRHAKSVHNDWHGIWQKTNMKTKDTELTLDGIYQAIRAGMMLNEILKTGNNKQSRMNDNLNSLLSSDLKEDNTGVRLNFYFTSDLVRTRQTLACILSQVNENYLTLNQGIIFTILPCSHELPFSKDGNCDSKINFKQAFTQENAMSCGDKIATISYDDKTITAYSDNKCDKFELKEYVKNILKNALINRLLNMYKGLEPIRLKQKVTDLLSDNSIKVRRNPTAASKSSMYISSPVNELAEYIRSDLSNISNEQNDINIQLLQIANLLLETFIDDKTPNITVKLDWRSYNNFYKTYRGDRQNGRYHCKNTSMIEEAMKIMQSSNKVGGGRKTMKRKPAIKTRRNIRRVKNRTHVRHRNYRK